MWRACLVLFVVLIVVIAGCRTATEPGTSPEMATATRDAIPTAPSVSGTATAAATQAATDVPDASEGDSQPASPVPGTPPSATPEAEVSVTPMGEIEGEGRDLPQVAIAVEDLAGRLDVAPESIEVLEVEARTWSDTSMGCPHPDMAYIQVPQDGLLIRLRVGDQVYSYHSGGTRGPFLCEQAIPGKSTPILIEPGEDT